MEQVNFEDVFADLIHSFESAADKIKKITDEHRLSVPIA